VPVHILASVLSIFLRTGRLRSSIRSSSNWRFATTKFLQDKAVNLVPNPQPGGPVFLLWLSPLTECHSFKAPGTRLHPISFATSRNALPKGYYVEVRVGFVSMADLMTVISWHFSGFIRLTYSASESLSEANTNLYTPLWDIISVIKLRRLVAGFS
jgi:hypothetical protein